jgi:hypothetical protein
MIASDAVASLRPRPSGPPLRGTGSAKRRHQKRAAFLAA